MRFWLTYLLTAAIGTAIVHFGAPSFVAHADFARRPLPAQQPSSVVAPAQGAQAPNPPRAPVQRPQRSVRLVPAQPPQPPQPAAPSATATVETTAASATPEQLETTVPEETPPTRPLYTPPPPDPNATSWGMVLRRAPHSGIAGNALGPLSAGTVVEIEKFISTASGDQAVCVIDANGQWKGPVLIGLEHLVCFEGPLTAAPAQAVDLLHRYYRLQEQIDARRAAHRKRAATANPHAAVYERAVTELQTFDERVRTLVAQRDASSGPKRSQLIDQLHGMQATRTRLRLHVEEAKAKGNAWTKQNPQATEDPHDPELEEWLDTVRQLEPQVKKYVP